VASALLGGRPSEEKALKSEERESLVTAPQTSAGRILVIEDDPSLQVLLRMQLEKSGYGVAVAGDGEEGLQAVEAAPPDLILMDVMMPKMDGHEVCRRLKSNQRTRQIPIIMLTSKAGTDDRVQGLDYGANDYVTKPYEFRELLMRVRNLIQWGRMQRDASPLTGLPGNLAIEAELTRRVQAGEDFVLMYIDLDNFKAFNDFYSYQKGDQALRLTGLLIQRAVESHGRGGDFVGHIGGDDFVVMVTADRAVEVADEIVRLFDEEVPALYSRTDRARGYIQVVNRKGDLEKYPLMSLTIAAVANESRSFRHVAEISDVAAELKHFGKQHKGSVVVWERRAS
jgi:diguanylate cyclase (GGDEF)-like protein